MRQDFEGFQDLDVHARCLVGAALDRGVAAGIVRHANGPGGGPGGRRGAEKAWLRLEAGRWSYLYRTGVLRRAPAGREEAPWRHINGASAFLTKDKSLTKAVLGAAGVSAPRGAVFGRGEGRTARVYFETLARPVCVKPNGGRKGILVFPALDTGAAFAAAFRRAAAAYDRVIVEESVTGEVIRYFYVAPRAVAVKLSLPANVVGDGASTIARLIDAKNAERVVRAVPGHLPIVDDGDLRGHLAGQGLSVDSVPAAGECVLLRPISNGASGADSIACADTTHPSYGAVIEAGCRALPGLTIAAIDMMVADRTVPAAPGNHWILEINSSPGVVPYHHPWAGPPQDVSGAIIDMLLRDAGP